MKEKCAIPNKNRMMQSQERNHSSPIEDNPCKDGWRDGSSPHLGKGGPKYGFGPNWFNQIELFRLQTGHEESSSLP